MTAHPPRAVLLLRLAGPLQSWGDRSAFNRRETRPEPAKSGIIGLLAAARGRRREEPIDDLADLALGVRVDRPGSLLRDYHTVSDYRGRPLPSAAVNARGEQKSAGKDTHVTQRFYLQDAVFLAAVAGPGPLITTLDQALRHPAFPLALGRRSCPPAQPLVLGIREGELDEVLGAEPWQAPARFRAHWGRSRRNPPRIDLPATLDDAAGDDVHEDVPLSFIPRDRAFTTRRVRHTYLSVPTGLTPAPDRPPATDAGHDPFALLGW